MQISHDNVVMHPLVWLCMVWFSASYANLKQPQHIEVQNLWIKPCLGIRVNMVTVTTTEIMTAYVSWHMSFQTGIQASLIRDVSSEKCKLNNYVKRSKYQIHYTISYMSHHMTEPTRRRSEGQTSPKEEASKIKVQQASWTFKKAWSMYKNFPCKFVSIIQRRRNNFALFKSISI